MLAREIIEESLLESPETALARVTVTELAALVGMTEGAINHRVAHGHLTPPVGGSFDRMTALAEIAAKPRQKGGRRPGQVDRSPAADGAQAEIRYRNARADREELVADRLRRDSFGREIVLRTHGAFVREQRGLILEVPAVECDALAEAFAQDPTAGGVKREMERVCRDLLERLSQRLFALAEEQPE